MNNLDTLPTPHADNIEKSCLSSLFQTEHVDGEEMLTSDHFFRPSHRRLYEMILGRPRPLDLVMFTEDAMRNKVLEDLGGPAAITEIYTYQPTTAHFADHVKTLSKFKARRQAIKAGHELIAAAYDTSDDTAFVEATGEPMTAISDTASCASKAREKQHVLSDLMAELEAKIRGEKSAMGWATNIGPIDRTIMGLHPARIVIVSGYPTSGKTVLAVQMMWELAMRDIPTLVISLEMPDKAIASRNLVIASRMPALAVSDPIAYAQLQGKEKPTKSHLLAMQKGMNDLRSKPIQFEDPTSPRMSQIVAIIRRHVRKHGTKAVAVDYLQLIKGDSKSWSKEQEVADISHTFQALAKELGIAIVLLSQQNKDGGTKYAEAITEDADAILSIIQNQDPDDDDFKKHIGIGVRKDRHHGNTGEFLPVVLNKEILKFVVEENHNQPT